ncbi:MAG TPA: aminotransferase class V-fold PLP-dependent enzyme [Candidatus Limnocylindrales bacterium]|nr:aminotransferase class V-fold PLP-dependent enzyme [Candidatus Limnocylindrales bacterium]
MPSSLVSHWRLDPGVTFLNHGSYGACPAEVLDAQTEWRARLERQPVKFLSRELDGALAEVRNAVGAFVGADPDDVGLIANATGGVNAVLRSLHFEPGDEILTTDHEYNAILNVARYVAARDGARVVVARLPFPAISEDDVVDRILAAATERTRLAVISHVTSPTGLVLPIDRIVIALNERGIDTLVDGAHAPGMVPLALDELGAAYYAANLHKWVCAPKGSAFLHVRRDRQEAVRPATISHGANAPAAKGPRFRSEFDWQGTLDPTAWLAVPTALQVVGGLVEGGWPAVMARNHALAIDAGGAMGALLGTSPSPAEMIGSMVALPLPEDGPLGGPPAEGQSSPLEADPLQTAIYDRFAIEVPIGPFPVPAAESPDPPRRLIRLSAALHNDRDDIDRLVDALRTIATSG